MNCHSEDIRLINREESVLSGILIFTAWAIGTFLGIVTGMGGPLLSVPVMAALKGMHCAVPAGNIQTICISAMLLWCFGRSLRIRPLLLMLCCCVPGILLGERLLVATGTGLLSAALGIYLISVVLVKRFSYFRNVKGRGTAFTVATGFATGVATATISASGPIVGVYASLMGWNKDEIRAYLGAFFVIVALGTVGLQAWHGLYTQEVFSCLAWALPGMAAGFAVGIPCSKRISQARYSGLVMAIIFASGILSLFNALR